MLHPGEVYFDSSPGRVRTVLGSCVALTAWHPKLKVGGMCHYLLPVPMEERKPHDERYGDVALRSLLESMQSLAQPSDFELSLFGGSSLFGNISNNRVGEDNVSYARLWLRRHELTLKSEHVLGEVCRTLILDLDDGTLYLKRYRPEFEEGPGEH